MSEPFSREGVIRQLDNCTYCPKMCRHACPVSTTSGKETYIPQVKMDRLNRLRLAQVEWSQANTDPLWACTGCRHCTVYCEHENEPGLVLFAGRAEAAKRGVTHPALTGYPQRFAKRADRLASATQTAFPEQTAAHATVAASGQPAAMALFPGCDALDKGTDDVAATLAVAKTIGLPSLPIVAAPHNCGGYPLLAAGQLDAFTKHARAIAASLANYRTVVVGCSACRFTMSKQYEAQGVQLAPKIISIAELLASNVSKLPRPATKKPVYYHDPCHLARFSGVTEEPRSVLRTVATLREFGWNHQDTECCGGGGLLPKTDPGTADAMAKRRLAEIHSQGGGTVVTSCGTCAYMLRSNAPASVEVRNLASTVATACRIEYEPPAVSDDGDEDA